MLRHTIVIPKPRLRVTLFSGDVVFEAPRLRSLTDLQKAVGAAMGLDCPAELVFCCGDTVLDRIEDAGEQVTAVRDGVMGLLGEFLRHAQTHDGRDLPKHLWPAREHRRLVLAAVRIDGLTLEYAFQGLPMLTSSFFGLPMSVTVKNSEIIYFSGVSLMLPEIYFL